MSTPTFRYRSTLTGQIADMTEDAASVFPEYLQRVADDAKPFEPGLFKPGKIGEFDNPEPLTDEQLAAQAELDAVSADHGPQSRVVKTAKQLKEEADAEAERKQAEADAADQVARQNAETAQSGANTEGA